MIQEIASPSGSRTINQGLETTLILIRFEIRILRQGLLNVAEQAPNLDVRWHRAMASRLEASTMVRF